MNPFSPLITMVSKKFWFWLALKISASRGKVHRCSRQISKEQIFYYKIMILLMEKVFKGWLFLFQELAATYIFAPIDAQKWLVSNFIPRGLHFSEIGWSFCIWENKGVELDLVQLALDLTKFNKKSRKFVFNRTFGAFKMT